MKKNLFPGFQYLVALCLTLISVAGWGQYSITGIGAANIYTQNFDTFRGNASTIPANWILSGTPNATYPIIYNGQSSPSPSQVNGNNYYAGRASSTSSDYSLLQKQGTSGASTFTFKAVNNSSITITGFVITWNVEQLISGYNRAATVDFRYQIDGAGYTNTNISGGTLYTSGTTGSTTTPSSFSFVNGTPSAYSITISDVVVPVGKAVDFQFTVANGPGTGSNPQVGIDDFTIYATAPTCTSPTPSFTLASVTKTLGDAPFTNAFTSNSTGTVTYSSSDTSVATVNSTTGEVTVVGVGNATVTANTAASNPYCATMLSYVLNVNPSSYTLTYDGNANTGGTPPAGGSYPAGGTVTVSGNTGNLIKTCANFDGWNTAANGSGTAYGPGASFTLNANTTLYAQWISTLKTITFNSNGGTGTMTAQAACAPEAIKTSAYTRAGYTFSGWNTAANGSDTAYSNGALYDFTADVTLYAQWTPNNNTITFDKNAADATGSTPPQILATGSSANLTTNGYSRSGYTFAGWATSASGIVVYADQASYTMGTGNVTLFAKWTANPYQVIFNKNHADATGTMSNQQIAYQTTSNLTSNAFARTGYVFKEWNTAADGSGTGYANSAAYTMSTLGDKTLYAQWEVYTGPCLSEDFTAGTNPAGWINSGTGITFGSYYADIAVNTGYITMASVSNPKTLAFDLSRTSNATVKNLNIEVSTTSQTSGFTVVANYDHSNTTSNGTTAVTVDLSAYSAASIIYIRFNKTSGSTSPWRIDNIQVFCGSSVPAPQISVTPAGNYAFPGQIVSTSSAPATFTIKNTGILDLTLGTISLSNTNADQFNVSQPSVTTLAPNATTTFTVTFAPTSTGVKTATVTIPNNTGTPYTFNITGTGALNAVPNNGLNLNTGACIANNQIKLNWTAASGGATGYIVYALAGTTAPAAASAGNASSYTANSDFSAAITYGTLGKAVYKGNGTTATITGLMQGQQYTFKVVAYNGETATGWAPGINTGGSWNATYTIKVPEVGNPAATVAPTSSVVSWNVVPASDGCYEYLVVASQGAVVFVPSGDGSTYTANPVYSAANQVVYKGTGNSVPVTGLTEGLQYCYKIFVREVNSSQWSEGVEICRNTGLSYCAAYGNTLDGTGITGVEFNTINNTSAFGDQGQYTDNTAVSTTLNIGESYNLSVRVNTGGDYTTKTKVWIDWNRNGSFDVPAEEYDLGAATNVTDGYTSLAPVSITVPGNAQVGTTRMRVSTKDFDYATPCLKDYYGEVEDYTVVIGKPVNAEINIKGGNISIPSGSTAVNSLNNTLFAATDLGSSSVEKTFTIENLGLTVLNLTGSPAVKLVGDHPADFTITEQPASTTVGINGSVTFKVKFNPVTADVRSAVVSISNDDPTGSENPYTFRIQGKGQCAAVPVISMFPTSGPARTVVTLTSGVNNLTGAEVKFNGVTLVPLSVNASEIKVKIPEGEQDGYITVRLQTGCVSAKDFDVITYENNGCDGAVSGAQLPTDLIIYEVYDDENGSGGFVSIFNGTSSSKNLSLYEIYRAGSPTLPTAPYTTGLHGSIMPGELKIIRYSGTNNCPLPASTGNGSFGSGFNEEDVFELRSADGNLVYDAVQAPPDKGYYMKRAANRLAGSTVHVPASWVSIDLVAGQCVPAGTAPVMPVGNSPSILSHPVFSPTCQSITLTVSASEGVSGGKTLGYQWYSLAPGASSWAVVVDSGIYSGATTDVLRIASAAGLGDYQYYAQVREDGAACYTASHAVQVEDTATSWTGTGWSNGLPTPVSRVLINGDYDTALHGDFTACSLEVSAGSHLKVRKGNVVTVVYDIINKAPADHVVIESDANLIQQQDIAPANTGAIHVYRSAKMKRLDYTYWSAPVSGQHLKAFSPGTVNSRFYTYNEWDDLFTPIDDPVTHSFEPAKGYAIRASNLYPAGSATVPAPVQNFQGIFKGVPNNGVITVGVEKSITGNGHNLVGNPYPSNIDFYALADQNAGLIHKKAYFWTNMNPNPAMQGSNYPTPVAGVVYYNNYAVLNGTGGIPATVNGVPPNELEAVKSATPTRNIKVGQGFIVQAVASGDLLYSNAVRNADSQSVFFNNKGGETEGMATDRFWLHLKTPLNVISTQLIGYLPQATNGLDGDYDAGLVVLGSDAFYSVLEDKKLGIQGRGVFSPADVVPLGSSHDAPGMFTVMLGEREGIFAEGQPVYLKDRQNGTLTDLTKGSYSFTAGSGISEGRFEIVYQPDTVLSAGDPAKAGMQVYRDGHDFVVKSPRAPITVLEVYDGSGRLVYRDLPHSAEVRIPGHLLITGLYMVKAELENGEDHVKKIRK